MKAGYVTIRTTTILLFGMAGTGKTTIKHLILNLPLPELQDSTPLADAKDRVLIRDIGGTKIQVDDKSWKPFTVNDLKKYAADLIRAYQVKTLEEPELTDETPSQVNFQQVAEVANEIQSLVELETPQEILCSNWIYLIDSGGQPHFHSLLPLFIQGISLAIYIFRLSDNLDDFPLVEYYRNGKTLGRSYRPTLSIQISRPINAIPNTLKRK